MLISSIILLIAGISGAVFIILISISNYFLLAHFISINLNESESEISLLKYDLGYLDEMNAKDHPKNCLKYVDAVEQYKELAAYHARVNELRRKPLMAEYIAVVEWVERTEKKLTNKLLIKSAEASFKKINLV